MASPWRARSLRMAVAALLVMICVGVVSKVLQPRLDPPEPAARDPFEAPPEMPPPVSVTEPEVGAEKPAEPSTIVVAVSCSSGLADPKTVQVILQRDQNLISETGRDDSRWVFKGLAPGRYELSFDDGSGPVPIEGVDLSPGTTEQIDLDVRGRTRLHIVADCATSSAEGLEVVLTPSPFSGQIVTRLDEDGSAICYAPRGTVQVRLMFDRVTLKTEEWILSKAHEEREIRIVSEPVALQVFGSDGKPLAACRVQYEPLNLEVPSLTVDTDKLGQATLMAMRGVLYRFQLTSGKCGSKIFGEKLIPEDRRTLELIYGGSGELDLTVVDADGQSMAAIAVSFKGPAGDRLNGITDDCGTVVLQDLAEGWYSASWLSPNAGRIRLVEDARVESGARTTLTVSVSFPACGSVSGRVLRDGKGVSGVTLGGAGPHGMAYVKSGRGGKFRFPSLYGNPVKIWVASHQNSGVAYSAVETLLGAKGVILEIEDACRVEITVTAPDLRECKQGPRAIWFRRAPDDAPTGVGMAKVPGTANRFFSEMVPAEASAICIGGAHFLRSAWQEVDLRPGKTTTLEFALGRSQRVDCRFNSPFSGIIILYSKRAGRWVEVTRSILRNEVMRYRFSRSELSGSAYRVHAVPVSGGELRGEVADCAESLEVSVPVSETGGSRIVVRTDLAGTHPVSLVRDQLSGWAGTGTGAVTRLVGTRPSEWTLEVRTGEVMADRPLVFGGLLPGRYRVVLDSELPKDAPIMEIGSHESKTVHLK